MIKYYLVGETHGTHECPEACLAILEQHHVNNLALEFDKQYQTQIDAYLRGRISLGKLSMFQSTPVHDGRASAAMKQLVEMAKKRRISIFLVDDHSDPSLRDKRMAENLGKIRGPVLFLCGNIHASKQPISLPWSFRLMNSIAGIFGRGMILPSGDLQTCGSYLPKKKTVSYNIVALNGGEYYNLGKKTISPYHNLGERVRDSQLPIIVKGDHGYDFIYIVERFTPSR